MADIVVPVKAVVDHSHVRLPIPRGSGDRLAGDSCHDPHKPLFTSVRDTSFGRELFLALYTKQCPWARCAFCALPSVSSPFDVSPEDVLEQVGAVVQPLSLEQRLSVRRVVVSNNGSVLHPETMPPGLLREVSRTIHGAFPRMTHLCLEARYETVRREVLSSYARDLVNWHEQAVKDGERLEQRPVVVQICAGYETQDPYLRNQVLNKGCPEELVQSFFRMCGAMRREQGIEVASEAYVLLKPAPGLSDAEAIAECVQTLVHLDELGRAFEVPVSARINPVFVARGTPLHESFLRGLYEPPALRDIVDTLLSFGRTNREMPIFVGLDEEGLEVDGGTFDRKTGMDALWRRAILSFNANQDYGQLAGSQSRFSARKNTDV